MKSSQTNGLDEMRAPNEMGATTWMTTLLGSHPAAKPKVSHYLGLPPSLSSDIDSNTLCL